MVFPSWHLFPKIALEKLFDVQKLPENGKTQSHLKSEFQEAIHVNPEQGRSVKFPCSLKLDSESVPAQFICVITSCSFTSITTFSFLCVHINNTVFEMVRAF